jgi:hypothetical protein
MLKAAGSQRNTRTARSYLEGSPAQVLVHLGCPHFIATDMADDSRKAAPVRQFQFREYIKDNRRHWDSKIEFTMPDDPGLYRDYKLAGVSEYASAAGKKGGKKKGGKKGSRKSVEASEEPAPYFLTGVGLGRDRRGLGL